MANRRMFSQQIVDSDAFLDMPQSSQLLYFHLAMRADDEGFVGNPKKIMRMVGSGEDDYKVLISKRFIIVFESSVMVIKHWLIHNTIRMDRFNETAYKEEKSLLTVKENKAYSLGDTTVNLLDTERQPSGNQVATQVKLSKVKLREEKYSSSMKYLLEIPESDLSMLREKYEASVSQIKRKAEQMYNYCQAKGKVYKNYRAFLENGLDKDFGRRVKRIEAPKEEKKIYTPQELKEVEESKKKINDLFKVKS